MQRVLCNSPYIPQAWIAAHGMQPVLLDPPMSLIHESVARTEGLCVWAQAWTSSALVDRTAAAIVVAQTCDQMRRIFEFLCAHAEVPCFLFNIPATWQSVQPRRLFQNEIARLGRFLEDAGGIRPVHSALSEQMLQGRNPAAVIEYIPADNEIPLALAGPHSMMQDTVWKEITSKYGGVIVLDLTQPPAPAFDRRDTASQPVQELADGCFDAIQDIFQRPNQRFYQRLKKSLGDAPVKGIILRRFLWCDLWHAEVQRLRQWAPAPVLDLEISGNPQDDRHRIATRIQSFLEMLS